MRLRGEEGRGRCPALETGWGIVVGMTGPAALVVTCWLWPLVAVPGPLACSLFAAVDRAQGGEGGGLACQAAAVGQPGGWRVMLPPLCRSWSRVSLVSFIPNTPPPQGLPGSSPVLSLDLLHTNLFAPGLGAAGMPSGGPQPSLCAQPPGLKGLLGQLPDLPGASGRLFFCLFCAPWGDLDVGQQSSQGDGRWLGERRDGEGSERGLPQSDACGLGGLEEAFWTPKANDLGWSRLCSFSGHLGIPRGCVCLCVHAYCCSPHPDLLFFPGGGTVWLQRWPLGEGSLQRAKRMGGTPKRHLLGRSAILGGGVEPW